MHAGSSQDDAQHIWMFQLQLQDATGTLLANVYGPDGDTFFTVEKVPLCRRTVHIMHWSACALLM